MITIPPSIPRAGGPLRRAFGRFLLGVMGWRITGDVPDVPKLVIIVAPHTSNWDFVVGFAAKLALSLRVTYFGKDTLFRTPLGWFFRLTGGIPVDRATSSNVVDQVVAEFAKRDRMLLALAPEGTRKKVAEWRTGFWHIAHNAGIPVLLVALDFGRKQIRIGPSVMTGSDADADIASIRGRYADVRGRNPENQ